MNVIKVKLVGSRPLLMHSDRFANPLDPLTKAHKVLTGKRRKTDEDHELIAKSEWQGGLYIDESGPYLPAQNIEASMLAAAKMSRLGPALKRGVQILEERCSLLYKGPRDAEGLWEGRFYDARSVRIQAARLMRFRPAFREWACEATVVFDPESMDRAQVIKCLEDAGQLVGIGDYRPRFGRFEVEVLQ